MFSFTVTPGFPVRRPYWRCSWHQAQPWLPAEAVAAEVLRVRPNAWPNLRVIELGDHMLDRRGELVEAAARIYRYHLAQEPGLADMLIANGRARELEAAAG